MQLLGAEAADPICLNPLYTFFKGMLISLSYCLHLLAAPNTHIMNSGVEIPGVGELMLASLHHNSSGGSAGGIGIFSGEW